MQYIDTSKIKDTIDLDKVVNYALYLEYLLVECGDFNQKALQSYFQDWYDEQLDKNKK